MNSAELRKTRHDSFGDVLKTDTLERVVDIAIAPVDLNAIGSEETDVMIQNGTEGREHFLNFFRTVGKSTVDEGRRSNFIKIGRTEPFDPIRFMDHRGLKIGEEDERSLMLGEIDPSGISLESMLQGETAIRGEEHLKRLKQMGHIRLDARVFQTLWENQHLIPKSWKGTLACPQHIFFDGTVLKDQHGRYVICMYWDKGGKWRWTYSWLDIEGWRIEDVSAVLKVY